MPTAALFGWIAERIGWRPSHTHVKRKSDYMMLGVASVQSSTAIVEGDMLAVYVAKDNTMTARPIDEFDDGRFVEFKSATKLPPMGDIWHVGHDEGADVLYIGKEGIEADYGHGTPENVIYRFKDKKLIGATILNASTLDQRLLALKPAAPRAKLLEWVKPPKEYDSVLCAATPIGRLHIEELDSGKRQPYKLYHNYGAELVARFDTMEEAQAGGQAYVQKILEQLIGFEDGVPPRADQE